MPSADGIMPFPQPTHELPLASPPHPPAPHLQHTPQPRLLRRATMKTHVNLLVESGKLKLSNPG